VAVVVPTTQVGATAAKAVVAMVEEMTLVYQQQERAERIQAVAVEAVAALMPKPVDLE
jgi:Trk K+ transport system NAD-binding subunit